MLVMSFDCNVCYTLFIYLNMDMSMSDEQNPSSEENEHENEHYNPELTRHIRPDTAILSSQQKLPRTGAAKIGRGNTLFGFGGDHFELILVIRGIVERLTLPESQTVILGRADARIQYMPDVDLTPYGALDRGVSREHARLHVENGHIYITDLGSTNGTFLSGEQLEPHQPVMLRKGDELLLGRLPIQVLFR
ncbi:MAG: hypothetical protein CUN56_05060 [Phototrophicales bacterium]|nr:MAG: hypothetical protein CUN56_05060 [Phototrophicales bacterium]RMG73405.1 MAG: FHA domain-containing protein [Chloroflexota bacterium]